MIDVSRDLERIRDYLGGRLLEDDRRAFEHRLLADPELVREVELSLRLREGLERLRASGRIDFVRGPAPRRARFWAAGAAVAAAAAGVAVVWWVDPTLRSASVLTASIPAVVTNSNSGGAAVARFTFVALRGFASTPVLALPARGVVELRIAPATRSAGLVYRVTLERWMGAAPRSKIGSVAGLAPGPDGFVRCFADASRLQPGDYALQIAGGDEPGAAQTFNFTLRSDASPSSP